MMFTSDKEKGRRAVLYHAVSSYQLLEVMLHRLINHEKEKAVLILPDFITQKYPKYQRLERLGLFDEVYLFPYLRIPHREEARILEDVSRCCQQRIPYEITDFSEIYVAGAHFYFSLYLIENHIPFSFFEDAAGMLSRWKEHDEALSKTFPIHAAIARKYGLFDGRNPYIRRIYCLKRAQTVNVSGERYEDFSVEEALQNLSRQKRKQVIRFFIKRRICTRADAILLTQQYANLGIMTQEEQHRLYEGMRTAIPPSTRLLIKRHPDDTLHYQDIFPHAKEIKEVFPAELLPYVFTRKPKVIYTFDPTGCENLHTQFQIRKVRRELYAE